MNTYLVTFATLTGPVKARVAAADKDAAALEARRLMDTHGRWLAPAGCRGVHPILSVRKAPARRAAE